jgi:hypothetical protein
MAAQEVGHGFGHRPGLLDVQEVTDAVDRAFLDLPERGTEEVGDLHPQRLGLGAQHGQDGLMDGGCLLGVEGVGQSSPLTALVNIARAPEWSPLPYASNTGVADFRNAWPRGSDTSVGSSRVSVCTFSA